MSKNKNIFVAITPSKAMTDKTGGGTTNRMKLNTKVPKEIALMFKYLRLSKGVKVEDIVKEYVLW